MDSTYSTDNCLTNDNQFEIPSSLPDMPKKVPATNTTDSDSDLQYEDCQAFLLPSAFVVPQISLQDSVSYESTLPACIKYDPVPLFGCHGKKRSTDVFILKENLGGVASPKGNLNPCAKEFKPSAMPASLYASIAATQPALKPKAGQKKKNNSSSVTAQTKSDEVLRKRIQLLLQTKKIIILMRGCPGSGKSTLAKKLLECLPKNKTAAILSTDDYFKDNRNNYCFYVERLSDAHAWNQQRALNAMKEGTDLVIIDNTNLTLWEMEPYANYAKENGYFLEIVEPNTAWKFKARKLAARNTHGVGYEKIVDMLKKYEEVTVHQLLRNKKAPRTSAPVINAETRSVQKESKRNYKRNRKRHRSANNGENKSNKNHGISESSETTCDGNLDDGMYMSLSSPLRPDSWGSDSNWDEPQLPKLGRVENLSDSECTDSSQSNSVEPSSDEEDMEHLASSFSFVDLGENAISSVTDSADVCSSLEMLALNCLLKDGMDENLDVADRAILEACQKKDDFLQQMFQKRSQADEITQSGTDLEQSGTDIAPQISDNSEGEPCLSDSVSDEDGAFYINYSIKMEFLTLLAQLFGPLEELENKVPDKEGFINTKLSLEHLSSLHKTLSEICQSKKEAKNRRSDNLPLSEFVDDTTDFQEVPNIPLSSSSATPDSLSQIMREQQEGQIELELKLQRNDPVTVGKLRKLCSEFPGYDPNIIEIIFQENDYNYTTTLAFLNGVPDKTGLDNKVFSDSPQQCVVRRTNTPKIYSRNRFLNWIQVPKVDYQNQIAFYKKRLSDSTVKKHLYNTQCLSLAKEYNQSQASMYKKELLKAELGLLKQEVADQLTPEYYNVVDLHGMKIHEAVSITKQCLQDYKRALDNGYMMKRNLTIITGKGLNNVAGRSVLKPPILSHIKQNSFRFIEDDGSIKVFF
ncbi:uncharacterized protein LOC115218429 isoform X2 [Octopus sinensis]|uniref:Uncharacterized protein LOC115218429 isoform X2 n=1 Tax=Octopus sinensis TaxID=2607531 RepID=A0A6P7T077_9MOLL|nr:uncharacterized protein LOC115218429 isoform X2 [Octopus sinensis]